MGRRHHASVVMIGLQTDIGGFDFNGLWLEQARLHNCAEFRPILTSRSKGRVCCILAVLMINYAILVVNICSA